MPFFIKAILKAFAYKEGCMKARLARKRGLHVNEAASDRHIVSFFKESYTGCIEKYSRENEINHLAV